MVLWRTSARRTGCSSSGPMHATSPTAVAAPPTVSAPRPRWIEDWRPEDRCSGPPPVSPSPGARPSPARPPAQPELAAGIALEPCVASARSRRRRGIPAALQVAGGWRRSRAQERIEGVGRPPAVLVGVVKGVGASRTTFGGRSWPAPDAVEQDLGDGSSVVDHHAELGAPAAGSRG